MTCYKNDDSRTERLAKLGLVPIEMEGLLAYTPTKFQHLSMKAMRNIIPFLEKGMTYDKACEEAGYDFKADSRGLSRSY